MKCCVCGKEYEEKAVGACPRCGFPSILMTDDSPEMQEALRQTVEEYRKQLLGEFSVYVRAYEFEKTSEELTEKGERRILIAGSGQLAPGKAVWSDLLFGVSDELVLSVELEKNEETRAFTLKMLPPGRKDSWRAGAMLDDELRLRLLVGDEEEPSVSDPVELIGESADPQ